MWKQLRSTWFAGSGAMVLVLSISGLVAAATITAAGTAPVIDPTVPTTQAFVDINGDGIADSCQAGLALVANPAAAAAEEAAVDLNGDGVISVSEAAQSGRIGGTSCNHGGYVSAVANASGQACDGTESATTTETSSDAGTVTTVTTTTDTTTTDTTTSDTTTCAAALTTTSTTSETTTVCTTTTDTTTSDTTTSDTTTTDTTTTDTAPNAHGKVVSEVAQSDAIGGKNCNHGGAVSLAAKDHTARDAAKAARDAARNAAKAARDAARNTHNLNKVHGRGHRG
jgi:hypothetical protein